MTRPDVRPTVLHPLFASTATFPGVGEKLAKKLERLGIERVINMLWHTPAGVIDRRYSPPLHKATDGKVATLLVRVDEHAAPAPKSRGKQPYKVFCHNETGTLELVFFHVKGDYLTKVLPIGQERVVSGKLEINPMTAHLQMIHPDYIAHPSRLESIKRCEPVYPMTEGVTSKLLQKLATEALRKLPELQDWNAKPDWPNWQEALKRLHRPDSEEELAPLYPVRARLAYDELLASQLALGLLRLKTAKTQRDVSLGTGKIIETLLKQLPFTLTGSQKQTFEEIRHDMGLGSPMMRLLQGDVGSGKTIVAFMAMLLSVECGKQAALMAPTDILARQHYANLQAYAEKLGLSMILLTGRDKGKRRQELLQQMADGKAPLIIGTHALFQDEAMFKNLGLAVIDEQQRFGVEQRMKLAAKNNNAVDVLLMTATPIPRTLTMTLYGDMDISLLKEKPAARQPITTRAVPFSRFDEVIEGIKRAVAKRQKIYWICPLVEESEASDLAAVSERYKQFCNIFGKEKCAMAHGKMNAEERDTAMNAFAAGDVSILVATTVVEVGVDVPSATIIVIEHAERFGLAQLHQLRGRVGRGPEASYCLLLYTEPLGEIARARLQCIRNTEDGFVIAEEDLKLRGGGEILGTRQSGLPKFKFADFAYHQNLLLEARDEAKAILQDDPTLTSPRGQALRHLLYLFEHEVEGEVGV